MDAGESRRSLFAGFTPDGRFAVVLMGLPWSIHHADGAYLLKREGNGWKIVLKQFVYYP